MIFALAIILLVLVILVSKQLRKRVAEKYFYWTISLTTISGATSALFGTLGFMHLDTLHNCPASYPYAWAALASGAVGVVALVYLAVFLLTKECKAAGLLILVYIGLLTVIAGVAWFAARACFTF